MELVAQNVFFYALAILMVVAAIRVVTTKNVVHAALWLVLVLAGVAAQFILLVAEFTAVVQVLVYIGAIIVLFLFGIMLTRAPMGESLTVDKNQAVMGALVAVPLLALMGYALIDSWGDDEVNFEAGAAAVVADDVEAEPGDAAVEVGDDASALIDSPTDATTGRLVDAQGSNVTVVSDSIFGQYLIAFEAISVLLLAALIGAIVLARKA
jgi:NADH-quinone oxidoreductase subunit J